LEEAFEVMDQEKIKSSLEQLQDVACSDNMNPCDLFNGAKELINILESSLKKLYLEEEYNFNKDEYVNYLEDTKTRKELFEMVKQIYYREIETYINISEAKERRHIRMSKQYISQHYAENITLEDIAELVFMNPVYFSVLFKKEEGVNFSNYLLHYRMTKAKQLLKDYSISITDVAGRVGYKDAKYFSKQFAKIVGIKPSEYRKLYL
jgi:two-component system response regulator YesN